MSIKTLLNLKEMIKTLRREAPELPIQQLQIFIHVALDEGTTAKNLQHATGMTQAAVGRNVNALLKFAGQGRLGLAWIEWRTDPNDLRARPLYLSTKGHKILAEIQTLMEK